MRRSTTLIVCLGLAVVGCNKKSADKSSSDPPAPKSTETTAQPAAGDTMPSIGVEAGGITREADEGAAAVVTAVTGTVELRRVGETEYAAAKADDKLYAGDAIRTGAESSATIALADESVIEVAEVSTVAVASRLASADPASGAAVLAGLARFTVTPRAPGEGAFRVYTPAGVVLTRGTVYGVAVAASGVARVGVESGAVDVIGLAALDGRPVAVDGGAAVELDAKGTVGASTPWPSDDWGTWRDEADATVEVEGAVDAHGAAMADLTTHINEAYADLDASADSIATFEANAAVAADKGDTSSYEASLPDGAATIDASFSVAGRLEALTWAYASHAALATDLYVRHPAKVEARWAAVAPRVDAAVLWPKRYEVAATGYLEPLRTQYYVHHPRGRLHAELVGVTVPEFYAKVSPPAIDPVRVRGRVKTRVWVAPEVHYTATTRPVWIGRPAVNWRAKAKIRPAPFRAKASWYVRPPALKAKVLVAAPPSAKYKVKLAVKPPQPRASLRAAWKIPVGAKVRIAPPNFEMAAKARANFKVGVGGGAHVRDHRGAAPNVKAKVGGKLDVRVPDVKAGIGVKVRDHRAGAIGAGKAAIGGGVKVGGDVRGKIGGGMKAGARAKVKVKAPAVKVKVKAPSVKVKGEAKGKIKLGL